MSASDALAAVAPGPAAAVASVPLLVFPLRILFTTFEVMSRRTKSLDEPPTWKPTLTPPTEYIAGVDHLPSKFWPLRQSKGPRPPLPPIPKPNFFTLGRMSTQLAFDNEVSEMLLPLRKPCNTKFACRSVSSSFSLSPANTGRIISSIMELRKQDKTFLLIRSLVFSDAVLSMDPFLSYLRCYQAES